MTKTLTPHSPTIQRAIGQVILAINADPAFHDAFLKDWCRAIATLEMDDDLR